MQSRKYTRHGFNPRGNSLDGWPRAATLSEGHDRTGCDFYLRGSRRSERPRATTHGRTRAHNQPAETDNNNKAPARAVVGQCHLLDKHRQEATTLGSEAMGQTGKNFT